jgi:hypothetical protein
MGLSATPRVGSAGFPFSFLLLRSRSVPDIDFFNFWRYLLGIIATIYATVVTAQSLWGWYVWLTGEDKYISIVRQYVIVHGLRLRFKTFWGDVLICLLLCVAFLILCHAHSLIYDLGDTLQDVRRIAQSR